MKKKTELIIRVLLSTLFFITDIYLIISGKGEDSYILYILTVTLFAMLLADLLELIKESIKNKHNVILEYFFIQEYTVLERYSLIIFCTYKNKKNGKLSYEMIQDINFLTQKEQLELIDRVTKELNIIPYEQSQYFAYEKKGNEFMYAKSIEDKIEKIKENIKPLNAENNKTYTK